MENQKRKKASKKLRGVPINNGKAAVAPTLITINDGSYAPLSRPIFIYVSMLSSKRPEVREFVNFYLTQASKIVKEVGYVPLRPNQYKEALSKFKQASLAE